MVADDIGPSTSPPTRIDLHTHSARSDGVLEPGELYRQQAAAGRRLIALTDHDTLAGVRELRAAGLGGGEDGGGESPGPRLVTGVEINSVTDDPTLWEAELHILGFGMAEDDPAFEAALAAQRAGRATRIAEMLERLRALGMPVDEPFQQVVAGAAPSSIGRPHVARALVRAGHATSVEDAFVRTLARGQAGYVPRRGLGPRSAIEAIRAAGGLPVLAHFREALERTDLVDRLIGWGLAGLEVHYGGHGRPFDAALRTALSVFASERGLVATGGSDYHGDEMGYAAATAGLHVPDEVEAPFLDALEAAQAAR